MTNIDSTISARDNILFHAFTSYPFAVNPSLSKVLEKLFSFCQSPTGIANENCPTPIHTFVINNKVTTLRSNCDNLAQFISCHTTFSTLFIHEITYVQKVRVTRNKLKRNIIKYCRIKFEFVKRN